MMSFRARLLLGCLLSCAASSRVGARVLPAKQFFPDESYGHDSSLEGEAANARDFEGGLAHYTALLPLRQLYNLQNLVLGSRGGLQDATSPKYQDSSAIPQTTNTGNSLGKRHSFSDWAGKRNGGLSDDQLVVSLRSFLENKLSTRDLGKKRRQFSAWAGKRSELPSEKTNITGDMESTIYLHGNESNGESLKKRANQKLPSLEFSNLEELLSSIRNANTDRRAFGSWSGKRGFSAWAGKRLAN